MNNVIDYSDLINIALKIGGLGIGVAVAVYIKPLSKSVQKVEENLDALSDGMASMTKALSKIDTSIAVINEKHKTKDEQITELMQDMRSVRDWKDDFLNEHATKIEINKIKIEDIQERMG